MRTPRRRSSGKFSGRTDFSEDEAPRSCCAPTASGDLPAADYIIALAEGTVAEQGTFEDLVASQGYVQRLGLRSSADSLASSENTTPVESPGESELPMLHAAETNTSSLVAPDVDASRQVGDKTVYKHYFKSMGLLVAASSVFFAALWGFFVNFSTICKSVPSPETNCVSTG